MHRSPTDESAPSNDSAPSPPAAAAPHRGTDPNVGLIATPVRALVRRAPVTIAPGASIRDAATLMREARVSSVLLVEDDRLVGIVTDRDLRNRVVAAAFDVQRPVADIATVAPLTVDIHVPAFDALLLMARRNVHHVPVMNGRRVVGMITATDVAQHQSTSAVFLASEIYRRDTIEQLQEAGALVRDLERHLVAADASAFATGQVITAIVDALTTRLLQLAEQRLGPAPVPYAWVAVGSQARGEQTARSDQDNCLVLDDAYEAATHDAYFDALSRFVCDGLDACGYVHCPGEMMAMTSTWRQPFRRWEEYFRRWIDEPAPEALMRTCVFFDLRFVHGESSLLERLRAGALGRTQSSGIFLAHLARNAVARRPPLGLLGRISTARKGPHRGTVDLKLTAIAPIIDLARIHALAGGHVAVNTQRRIEQAVQGRQLSAQGAHDLRDALEFLSVVRIRHQVRQVDDGQPADSHLALDELSNFERTQLKEAFVVVQLHQEALAQTYQLGRF